MENTIWKNKKVLVSLLVIVLGIFALVGYKTILNNKQVQGLKEYTLIVTDTGNTFNEEFKFKTEETLLGKDLENRGLIETNKSAGSRFVTAVNGRVADTEKQQWWNLKINGQNSIAGIDDTAINDKDKIEFILTTGW